MAVPYAGEGLGWQYSVLLHVLVVQTNSQC